MKLGMSEILDEGHHTGQTFDDMYDTEREDIEKKNFEWLNNMLLIIDLHEYRANIRRGAYAFTVNFTERARSSTKMRSGRGSGRGNLRTPERRTISDTRGERGKVKEQVRFTKRPTMTARDKER